MVSKPRTGVQKDKQKNARPTKVHKVKEKFPRRDKYKGKVYDDWFEQDIAMLVENEDEST